MPIRARLDHALGGERVHGLAQHRSRHTETIDNLGVQLQQGVGRVAAGDDIDAEFADNLFAKAARRHPSDERRDIIKPEILHASLHPAASQRQRLASISQLIIQYDFISGEIYNLRQFRKRDRAKDDDDGCGARVRYCLSPLLPSFVAGLWPNKTGWHHFG